jgi:hypothetical protein
MTARQFPTIALETPELEPIHAALRDLRMELTTNQASLRDAERSARRSPTKWAPIVNALKLRMADLHQQIDTLEQQRNTIREREQAERNEVFAEVKRAIMETAGEYHPQDNEAKTRAYSLTPIGGVPGVDETYRMALVDASWNDRIVIEAQLVQLVDGKPHKVFGYGAEAFGPEQTWRSLRDSDEQVVSEAYARLSSGHSGVKSLAQSTIMQMVNQVALTVAAELNAAFGIEPKPFADTSRR